MAGDMPAAVIKVGDGPAGSDQKQPKADGDDRGAGPAK